jgi:hypothetical protein
VTARWSLLVVGVVIWRAMEWRYHGVIDLWKTMHTQAAAENEIVGSRLAETKRALEELQASEKKLTELAAQNPPIKEAVLELSQATATAGNNLVAASTANDALTDALTRAPQSYSMRRYDIRRDSSGRFILREKRPSVTPKSE